MRIKAADVTTGDKVLRYGMWFHVEKIELLPAERGGQLLNFWLQPVSAGGACFLALFPEETITTDRAQAQEVEG